MPQIATGQGGNPLVLATFRGMPTDKPRMRVLFYGYVILAFCLTQDYKILVLSRFMQPHQPL